MHPYGRVTLKKDFASGFSHIMVIFIGEDTKARHLPGILAQLRIIPKEMVRKNNIVSKQTKTLNLL